MLCRMWICFFSVTEMTGLERNVRVDTDLTGTDWKIREVVGKLWLDPILSTSLEIPWFSLVFYNSSSWCPDLDSLLPGMIRQDTICFRSAEYIYICI
jgi:hypothetical protein